MERKLRNRERRNSGDGNNRRAPQKPPRPGHVFFTDIPTLGLVQDLGFTMALSRREPGEKTGVIVKKGDSAAYEAMAREGGGRYVTITSIRPGSYVDHQGRLRSGDYVLEINGTSLAKRNLAQVREILANSMKSGTVSMAAVRPRRGKSAPPHLLHYSQDEPMRKVVGNPRRFIKHIEQQNPPVRPARTVSLRAGNKTGVSQKVSTVSMPNVTLSSQSSQPSLPSLTSDISQTSQNPHRHVQSLPSTPVMSRSATVPSRSSRDYPQQGRLYHSNSVSVLDSHRNDDYDDYGDYGLGDSTQDILSDLDKTMSRNFKSKPRILRKRDAQLRQVRSAYSSRENLYSEEVYDTNDFSQRSHSSLAFTDIDSTRNDADLVYTRRGPRSGRRQTEVERPQSALGVETYGSAGYASDYDESYSYISNRGYNEQPTKYDSQGNVHSQRPHSIEPLSHIGSATKDVVSHNKRGPRSEWQQNRQTEKGRPQTVSEVETYRSTGYTSDGGMYQDIPNRKYSGDTTKAIGRVEKPNKRHSSGYGSYSGSHDDPMNDLPSPRRRERFSESSQEGEVTSLRAAYKQTPPRRRTRSAQSINRTYEVPTIIVDPPQSESDAESMILKPDPRYRTARLPHRRAQSAPPSNLRPLGRHFSELETVRTLNGQESFTSQASISLIHRGASQSRQRHLSESSGANKQIIPQHHLAQTSPTTSTYPPPLEGPANDVTRIIQGTKLLVMHLIRDEQGIGLWFAEDGDGCRRIIITHIDENSPAHRDGRLSVGDEVLMVNGQTIEGQSPQEVSLSLNQSASNIVQLVVTRTVTLRCPDVPNPTRKQTNQPEESHGTSATTSSPSYNHHPHPHRNHPLPQQQHPHHHHHDNTFEVVLVKRPGRRLGFSVVGGADTSRGHMGFFIHNLAPDGLAAEEGNLHDGNEIVRVNGQTLEGLTHMEAISKFRTTPDGIIRLTVRKVGNKRSLRGESESDDTFDAVSREQIQHRKESIEGPSIDPHHRHHDGTLQLYLYKQPGRGLGVGVVHLDVPSGGKGIFVTDIAADSPAKADGMLRCGDQIVCINGTHLESLSLDQSFALFGNLQPGPVILEVRRGAMPQVEPMTDPLPMPPLEFAEFHSPKPRKKPSVGHLKKNHHLSREHIENNHAPVNGQRHNPIAIASSSSTNNLPSNLQQQKSEHGDHDTAYAVNPTEPLPWLQSAAYDGGIINYGADDAGSDAVREASPSPGGRSGSLSGIYGPERNSRSASLPSLQPLSDTHLTPDLLLASFTSSSGISPRSDTSSYWDVTSNASSDNTLSTVKDGRFNRERSKSRDCIDETTTQQTRFEKWTRKNRVVDIDDIIIEFDPQKEFLWEMRKKYEREKLKRKQSLESLSDLVEIPQRSELEEDSDTSCHSDDEISSHVPSQNVVGTIETDPNNDSIIGTSAICNDVNDLPYDIKDADYKITPEPDEQLNTSPDGSKLVDNVLSSSLSPPTLVPPDQEQSAIENQKDVTGLDQDISVTDMPLADVTEVLMLHRLPGEKLGMGLSIESIGGDNDPVRGVFIESITPGGAADRASGGTRGLCVGDEILEVNGTPLKDVSYSETVTFFREMPLHVIFRVRRKPESHPVTKRLPKMVPTSCETSDSESGILSADRSSIPSSFPDDFELLEFEFSKKAPESLGLSIIPSYGDTQGYFQVKKVLQSGVCARDGRVQVGDRLVAYNEFHLHALTHMDCMNILKGHAEKIRLLVLRRIGQPSEHSESATPESSTTPVSRHKPPADQNGRPQLDESVVNNYVSNKLHRTFDIDDEVDTNQLFAQSPVRLAYGRRSFRRNLNEGSTTEDSATEDEHPQRTSAGRRFFQKKSKFKNTGKTVSQLIKLVNNSLVPEKEYLSDRSTCSSARSSFRDDKSSKDEREAIIMDEREGNENESRIESNTFGVASNFETKAEMNLTAYHDFQTSNQYKPCDSSPFPPPGEGEPDYAGDLEGHIHPKYLPDGKLHDSDELNSSDSSVPELPETAPPPLPNSSAPAPPTGSPPLPASIPPVPSSLPPLPHSKHPNLSSSDEGVEPELPSSLPPSIPLLATQTYSFDSDDSIAPHLPLSAPPSGPPPPPPPQFDSGSDPEFNPNIETVADIHSSMDHREHPDFQESNIDSQMRADKDEMNASHPVSNSSDDTNQHSYFDCDISEASTSPTQHSGLGVVIEGSHRTVELPRPEPRLFSEAPSVHHKLFSEDQSDLSTDLSSNICTLQHRSSIDQPLEALQALDEVLEQESRSMQPLEVSTLREQSNQDFKSDFHPCNVSGDDLDTKAPPKTNDDHLASIWPSGISESNHDSKLAPTHEDDFTPSENVNVLGRIKVLDPLVASDEPQIGELINAISDPERSADDPPVTFIDDLLMLDTLSSDGQESQSCRDKVTISDSSILVDFETSEQDKTSSGNNNWLLDAPINFADCRNDDHGDAGKSGTAFENVLTNPFDELEDKFVFNWDAADAGNLPDEMFLKLDDGDEMNTESHTEDVYMDTAQLPSITSAHPASPVVMPTQAEHQPCVTTVDMLPSEGISNTGMAEFTPSPLSQTQLHSITSASVHNTYSESLPDIVDVTQGAISHFRPDVGHSEECSAGVSVNDASLTSPDNSPVTHVACTDSGDCVQALASTHVRGHLADLYESHDDACNYDGKEHVISTNLVSDTSIPESRPGRISPIHVPSNDSTIHDGNWDHILASGCQGDQDEVLPSTGTHHQLFNLSLPHRTESTDLPPGTKAPNLLPQALDNDAPTLDLLTSDNLDISLSLSAGKLNTSSSGNNVDNLIGFNGPEGNEFLIDGIPSRQVPDIDTVADVESETVDCKYSPAGHQPLEVDIPPPGDITSTPPDDLGYLIHETCDKTSIQISQPSLRRDLSFEIDHSSAKNNTTLISIGSHVTVPDSCDNGIQGYRSNDDDGVGDCIESTMSQNGISSIFVSGEEVDKLNAKSNMSEILLDSTPASTDSVNDILDIPPPLPPPLILSDTDDSKSNVVSPSATPFSESLQDDPLMAKSSLNVGSEVGAVGIDINGHDEVHQKDSELDNRTPTKIVVPPLSRARPSSPMKSLPTLKPVSSITSSIPSLGRSYPPLKQSGGGDGATHKTTSLGLMQSSSSKSAKFRNKRSENEPFQIEVLKGLLGLGLKVEMTPEGYTQVTEVQQTGPIGRNGNIRVGDYILSLNGTQFAGLSESKVQQTVWSAPRGLVRILVSATQPTKATPGTNENEHQPLANGDGEAGTSNTPLREAPPILPKPRIFTPTSRSQQLSPVTLGYNAVSGGSNFATITSTASIKPNTKILGALNKPHVYNSKYSELENHSLAVTTNEVGVKTDPNKLYNFDTATNIHKISPGQSFTDDKLVDQLDMMEISSSNKPVHQQNLTTGRASFDFDALNYPRLPPDGHEFPAVNGENAEEKKLSVSCESTETNKFDIHHAKSDSGVADMMEMSLSPRDENKMNRSGFPVVTFVTCTITETTTVIRPSSRSQSGQSSQLLQLPFENKSHADDHAKHSESNDDDDDDKNSSDDSSDGDSSSESGDSSSEASESEMEERKPERDDSEAGDESKSAEEKAQLLCHSEKEHPSESEENSSAESEADEAPLLPSRPQPSLPSAISKPDAEYDDMKDHVDREEPLSRKSSSHSNSSATTASDTDALSVDFTPLDEAVSHDDEVNLPRGNRHDNVDIEMDFTLKKSSPFRSDMVEHAQVDTISPSLHEKHDATADFAPFDIAPLEPVSSPPDIRPIDDSTHMESHDVLVKESFSMPNELLVNLPENKSSPEFFTVTNSDESVKVHPEIPAHGPPAIPSELPPPVPLEQPPPIHSEFPEITSHLEESQISISCSDPTTNWQKSLNSPPIPAHGPPPVPSELPPTIPDEESLPVVNKDSQLFSHLDEGQISLGHSLSRDHFEEPIVIHEMSSSLTEHFVPIEYDTPPKRLPKKKLEDPESELTNGLPSLKKDYPEKSAEILLSSSPALPPKPVSVKSSFRSDLSQSEANSDEPFTSEDIEVFRTVKRNPDPVPDKTQKEQEEVRPPASPSIPRPSSASLFENIVPRSRLSSIGSDAGSTTSDLGRVTAPPLQSGRRESIMDSMEKKRRETSVKLRGLLLPSKRGSSGMVTALPTIARSTSVEPKKLQPMRATRPLSSIDLGKSYNNNSSTPGSGSLISRRSLFGGHSSLSNPSSSSSSSAAKPPSLGSSTFGRPRSMHQLSTSDNELVSLRSSLPRDSSPPAMPPAPPPKPSVQARLRMSTSVESVKASCDNENANKSDAGVKSSVTLNGAKILHSDIKSAKDRVDEPVLAPAVQAKPPIPAKPPVPRKPSFHKLDPAPKVEPVDNHGDLQKTPPAIPDSALNLRMSSSLNQKDHNLNNSVINNVSQVGFSMSAATKTDTPSDVPRPFRRLSASSDTQEGQAKDVDIIVKSSEFPVRRVSLEKPTAIRQGPQPFSRLRGQSPTHHSLPPSDSPSSPRHEVVSKPEITNSPPQTDSLIFSADKDVRNNAFPSDVNILPSLPSTEPPVLPSGPPPVKPSSVSSEELLELDGDHSQDDPAVFELDTAQPDDHTKQTPLSHFDSVQSTLPTEGTAAGCDIENARSPSPAPSDTDSGIFSSKSDSNRLEKGTAVSSPLATSTLIISYGNKGNDMSSSPKMATLDRDIIKTSNDVKDTPHINSTSVRTEFSTSRRIVSQSSAEFSKASLSSTTPTSAVSVSTSSISLSPSQSSDSYKPRQTVQDSEFTTDSSSTSGDKPSVQSTMTTSHRTKMDASPTSKFDSSITTSRTSRDTFRTSDSPVTRAANVGSSSDTDPERSSSRTVLSTTLSSSTSTTSTSSSNGVASESGMELLDVELHKGVVGLGFCIAGGHGSPLGDKPITVKRLFKGDAAAHGKLHPGDEIVSANGRDFANLSHFTAWNHLKSLPEGSIQLVIRRQTSSSC